MAKGSDGEHAPVDRWQRDHPGQAGGGIDSAAQAECDVRASKISRGPSAHGSFCCFSVLSKEKATEAKPSSRYLPAIPSRPPLSWPATPPGKGSPVTHPDNLPGFAARPRPRRASERAIPPRRRRRPPTWATAAAGGRRHRRSPRRRTPPPAPAAPGAAPAGGRWPARRPRRPRPPGPRRPWAPCWGGRWRT